MARDWDTLLTEALQPVPAGAPKTSLNTTIDALRDSVVANVTSTRAQRDIESKLIDIARLIGEEEQA